MVTTNVDFTVRAAVESLAPTRRRVAALAAGYGMSQTVVDDLRLCVTEAMANSVRHAYDGGRGTVEVEVELDESRRELTVVVRDRGRGISPKRDEPEPGYGLKIIRELSPRSTVLSSPWAGTEVRMKFDLDHSALQLRSADDR